MDPQQITNVLTSPPTETPPITPPDNYTISGNKYDEGGALIMAPDAEGQATADSNKYDTSSPFETTAEPARAFVDPDTAFETDQSTVSEQLPMFSKGVFTKAYLPGERQDELMDYFRMVADAEYSQEAANEVIEDMINGTGDFAKGEFFEGIDPTLALKNLVGAYPDPNPYKLLKDRSFFSYDLMDEYDSPPGPAGIPPQLTPPKYSDGAEVLKKYLRSEKYKKENPKLSFFDSLVKGIKNGFEDIPVGINKTAWHGVNTLLALLNWGTGEFVDIGTAFTDMTPEQAKAFRARVYDLSNYIVEPEPLTYTGKLTAAGTETYLTYVTGHKVYSTLAPRLAKWVPLMANALKTEGLKVATAEAIGSGLIMSGEMRWATLFSDLGANNAVVESLKHSEDETVFQERWNSFIDGTYSGPALASIKPVLGLLGTTAYILYKASQKGIDITKRVWNKPRAVESLNAASTLWVQIRQNYPLPKGERLELPDELSGNLLDDLNKIKKKAAKTMEEVAPDATLDDLLKAKGAELEGTRVVRIPNDGITEFDAVLKTIDEDSITSFIEKSGEFDWLASKQEIFNLKHIDDTVVKNQISGIADHIDNLIDLSEKPHIQSLKEGVDIHNMIRSEIAEATGEEGVDLFIKEFAQSTQATTGTLLAIKMYTHEAMRGLAKHTEQLATLIRKGESLTPEQKVAFSETYFRTLGRLVADRTIARSTGRALNIQKITHGPEEFSQKIIDSFEEGSDIESLILALDGQGIKGTSEVIRRTRMAASFDVTKASIVNGLLSSPGTLSAVPIGLMTYIGVKHGTTWVAAGLNPLLKPFYTKGMQNPITFGEARQEGFGLFQAGLELLNGAGYYARSATKKGVDAARSLDSAPDGGFLGLGKQVGKETDRLTGAPITMTLPIVGKFNIQKGLSEEALSDMLPNIPKEEIPDFIKFIINGLGAAQGVNARAIMSQDGYFRTYLERMVMHRESYAMARKRKLATLPKDKNGRPVGKPDPDEVLEEAFHITKNLPESIEKKMRHEGTVGLMQEDVPWLIKKSDEIKNTTHSNAPNGGMTDVGIEDVKDFAKNSVGTYWTQNMSFQKTTYNIFKQSLTEQGMYKLANTLLKGKNRRRFMKDQRYAQDIIARTIVGTAFISAGIALSYSAGKSGWQWFGKNISEPLQKYIRMEGINANLPGDNFARKIQGRTGPEVILRNAETGVETVIPISRLDVAKQPIILGAIFGSYWSALNEAEQEASERGWTTGKYDEVKEDITQQFAYAMGNLVLDQPMMRGLKETSQMIPGWGNDNWNWTKEVGTFIGDGMWHNTILSNFRKGINKVDDEFRMGEHADQKRKWGDVAEGSKFETKLGVDVPLTLKQEPIDLNPIARIILTVRDIHEKVGLMDIDTDPENPVVGSLLYQAVDPEGNLIRYIPSESKSKIAQGLKILVLPWYPKVVSYSNTTYLMEKLDIPYDPPKKWDTGTKAPLSAEQRYVWAVLAGRKNKETFESDVFNSTIQSLKDGIWDNSQNGRITKKAEKMKIESILSENKQAALMEMINMPRNSDLKEYWVFAKGVNKHAKTPF